MMQKKRKIWINGYIIDESEVHIPFMAHGLHYGYGVLEGIRCRLSVSGEVLFFRLADHLKRLEESAGIVGLPFPYMQEEIQEAVHTLVRENGMQECYIRPLLFYKEGFGGLHSPDRDACLAIGLWEWKLPPLSGSRGEKSLLFSSFLRNHPCAIPPGAKMTGGYANSCIALQEAERAGKDDALLCDTEGNIAEATTSNVFMVKGGALFTPPLTNCLNGITRRTVVSLAEYLQIPLYEKPLSKEELRDADEIFLTGTASGIVPVSSLEEQVIEGRKVTEAIQKLYARVVTGNIPRFRHWVEPLDR